MIYALVFILLLLLSMLESNVGKRCKWLLQSVAYILLVMVAGTRYETGGDWQVYAHLFDRIMPLSVLLSTGNSGAAEIEPAFVWLCAIVKQLGGNIQVVFFLITWLNISLLWIALRKYTRYVLLGMLAYYSLCYFALDMLYTRQSTSVLLAFLAVSYTDRWQDIWKYALCIAAAALCHRMALIMVAVYPLFHFRISNLTIWILVGIGCALMLLGVKWLSPIYLSVSQWLGPEFYDKAEVYTSSHEFAVSRFVSVGFFLNLLLLALITWRRESLEALPHGSALVWMFVIGLMVYYFGYELIELSNRFRFYFMIALVALFPMLIQSFTLAPNRYLIGLAIVVYLFIFSRGIFLNQPEAVAYHPYQNYIVYKIAEKRSSGAQRLEQSIRKTRQIRNRMKR